ncbi:MAG TPA: hypothetical protein VEI52_02220 [Terriglobales bacterium]|nr:hypothetical protein [Terriglobales bacterium]
MLSLVALLSIIVVFLLIELNRDTELDDFAKRMIQFHEGIELENEVMRWLLSHPKKPISANQLGKELSRPVDHIRSALERLGVAETPAVARAKDEVGKPVANSGSNSSRQVENVSCGDCLGETRVH